MNNPWKAFWSTYRHTGSISEHDLFEQVGRTVHGAPIPMKDFDATISLISAQLQLSTDDVLFEYCCGNGLVTHALAPQVERVIGIDFTEHLIEAAMRYRSRQNIDYFVADALQPIRPWLGDAVPAKFLMASALGHFEPDGFDQILGNLCEAVPSGSRRFLLTGIPDYDRKWDFYDTPERKAKHMADVADGNIVNDVGHWWRSQELLDIAGRHGFSAEISPEPAAISHYRMNALLY